MAQSSLSFVDVGASDSASNVAAGLETAANREETTLSEMQPPLQEGDPRMAAAAAHLHQVDENMRIQMEPQLVNPWMALGVPTARWRTIRGAWDGMDRRKVLISELDTPTLPYNKDMQRWLLHSAECLLHACIIDAYNHLGAEEAKRQLQQLQAANRLGSAPLEWTLEAIGLRDMEISAVDGVWHENVTVSSSGKRKCIQQAPPSPYDFDLDAAWRQMPWVHAVRNTWRIITVAGGKKTGKCILSEEATTTLMEWYDRVTKIHDESDPVPIDIKGTTWMYKYRYEGGAILSQMHVDNDTTRREAVVSRVNARPPEWDAPRAQQS